MYEYLWLHYKPAAAAIICCVYLCMYMNIKRQFKPQSATCAQRKRQIMTTSFFLWWYWRKKHKHNIKHIFTTHLWGTCRAHIVSIAIPIICKNRFHSFEELRCLTDALWRYDEPLQMCANNAKLLTPIRWFSLFAVSWKECVFTLLQFGSFVTDMQMKWKWCCGKGRNCLQVDKVNKF